MPVRRGGGVALQDAWMAEVPMDPFCDVVGLFLSLGEAESPPTEVRAPYEEYHDDPVGFAGDVLGMEPWEREPTMPAEVASQADVLRAVAKYRRVADKSGQKTGKSSLAAVAALWWVYTRVQGYVVLTAPSAPQVDAILWTEIRLVAQGHHPTQRAKGFVPKLPGVNGEPGGRLYESASHGLSLGDGWGITGRTTDKPERMQGPSGANQFYIVDEASGYSEANLQAILGNLAGGGHILMLSNPTQVTGTFFDAFHDKAEVWETFSQSSLHTPNFHGKCIPGLADADYERLAKVDWGGPGNPMFDARVLGRFPSAGAMVVVPLSLVEAAKARWAEAPWEGRLEVGLDPSRGGDECVYVFRRGLKVAMPVPVHVDANDVEVPPGWQVGAAVARAVLEEHALHPHPEKPRVKVDAIGVGTSVVDYLMAKHRHDFDVIAVVSSGEASPRVQVRPGRTAKDEYTNLRSQIAFGVPEFLRAGGALPPDGKLHGDLVAAKYKFVGEKTAVEEKREITKRLRRSPDRGDAVGLVIYVPAGRRSPPAPPVKPPPLQCFPAGAMGWG